MLFATKQYYLPQHNSLLKEVGDFDPCLCPPDRRISLGRGKVLALGLRSAEGVTPELQASLRHLRVRRGNPRPLVKIGADQGGCVCGARFFSTFKPLQNTC